MAEEENLKVRVTSGAVDLYITLTPKLLAKPLEKAIITPFIGAYNKKTPEAKVSFDSLTAANVTGGAVDGPVTKEACSDEASPASSFFGTTGDSVVLNLTFYEQSMPMFTDGMSEVEKLKARRRAENAAKRAAAAAEGGGEAAEVSDPAPAEAAPAPAPPPPAPTETGALGQIAKAEAKAEALATEIAAVEAEVGAAADTATLDGLSKRAAAVGGVVGQLMSMMDEIDLGEIEDDEARSAARARRKKINARVEGEFDEKKQALNAAVKAARAKLG